MVGREIGAIRHFDGEVYHDVYPTYHKKAQANKEAKSIRANQYNARVVKVSGGYRVYTTHSYSPKRLAGFYRKRKLNKVM